MRKILFAVLLLLFASPVGAQVLQGGAVEPTGYQRGFSKNQWAASLGCMISAYGTTNFNQNAIRCYNPLTNTWTVLFAQGNAGSAEGDQTPGVNPSGRDNEVSLYVDNVKEFWVWGGTHGNMSGRFNLSACAPTPSPGCATLITAGPGDEIPAIEVGFVGAPAPAPGGGSDSGAAWNPACDGGVGCGIIVGGNGAPDDQVWIIERNTAAQITALGGTSHKYCPNGAGVKLWIVCEFTGTKPPARNQALGSTVAAGNDFYVAAGTAPDNSTHRPDLWKFTRSTNTFSLVSNAAPFAGYQSSVTYDSDLNIVFITGSNANTSQFLIGWDFNLTTPAWVDFSAIVAGLDCQIDQASAYSPTAKRHIYGGGSYCPGPPHFDASLPEGYIYQVSPSGFTSAAGRLYLAPGLWVTKSLPPTRTLAQNQTIGETGFGPGVSAGGAKHQRIRYGNGRLYFLHGDFDTGPFDGALRSDMFSYDILAPSSVAEASRWRLEWPYCGLSGEVSPAHLDEGPFAIDTARNKILYAGGFSGQNSASYVGICGPHGITGTYYGTLGQPNGAAYMEFDMATKRFALRPGWLVHPYGQTNQGVYNPTTDELIVPKVGNTGFSHMAVSTGVWTPVDTICATPGPGVLADTTGPCAPTGNYINNTSFYKEQLAIDIANQVIYVIDTSAGQGSTPNPDVQQRNRLFKYNIATHVITNYGFIPLPVGTDTVQTPGVNQPHFCHDASRRACTSFPFYVAPQDSTMLVYDSVNHKVLWPASSNSGRPILLVWDPATNAWSVDQMVRDNPSFVLHGSNGEYIEAINAMVMFGGFGNPGFGGDQGDAGPGNCLACVIPISGGFMYRLGGTTPVQSNPNATLTVNSTPATGVAITVDTADINGDTSGSTNFQRTYLASGTVNVSLVAPATSGANSFSAWTGCDLADGTGNRTCHVSMTMSKTVTAVYSTGAATFNLTINSTPAGLPITLSSGTCSSTPCVIAYTSGTNVVATAPLTAGLASYTLWTGCTSMAGNACTANMNGDKTILAPYVSGTSYQPSTDFSNVQNQRNWSYRYGAGTLMTFNSEGRWGGPEGSLLIMPGGFSHPGTANHSMLRWTAPSTQAIRVTGNFRSGAAPGAGDGVDVTVSVNGAAPILTVGINNGDFTGTNYDFPLTVTSGDTLDFIVARRTTNSNDTTVVNPLISPAASRVTFGGLNLVVGDGVVFGR